MTSVRPSCRAAHRALVASAVAGALLASAAPAAAHARLESSDPSAGQRLAAVPERIRLVFSSDIDDHFARVVLSASDGSAQELPVDVAGDVLVARVPAGAGVRPGDWRIDFRVVSADGHPVSGTVPFEVLAAEPTALPTSAAAPPTPTPSPPADVRTRSVAAVDEPQPGVWPWFVGGALLLGGGLVLLGRRSATGRRPRA